MASFNGVDLGLVFRMNTAANPKSRQVNTYAGANGLEIIDQGSRGGSTDAEGAIINQTPYGLAAVDQQFRALQLDGSPFALVDTLGTTWPGVILVQYKPEGRVYRVIGPFGLLYFGRKYRAEFLHVF
jgi:hypothetical protein